jgi:arsenite oxidase small subunit
LTTLEDKLAATKTEPLWRDEFSVFQDRERVVTRRQLVKFLPLTSLGMFVGNLWILLGSWMHRDQVFPRQQIAQVREIPVDGVKLIRYPSALDQCLLVRIGEERYVAYSQKCTHLSSAVHYSREDHQLIRPLS